MEEILIWVFVSFWIFIFVAINQFMIDDRCDFEGELFVIMKLLKFDFPK